MASTEVNGVRIAASQNQTESVTKRKLAKE
jgi:hypothetical protein